MFCPPSDLKFYQQVKLVNFIRRQIHQSRCYGCTRMFDCRADALRHIAAEGHVMKPPGTSRSRFNEAPAELTNESAGFKAGVQLLMNVVNATDVYTSFGVFLSADENGVLF